MDEIQVPSFVNEKKEIEKPQNNTNQKIKKVKFYNSLKKVIGITAITGGAILLFSKLEKPITNVVSKIVEYDNEQFEKEFEHMAYEVEELTGKTPNEIMGRKEESKTQDDMLVAGAIKEQYQNLKEALNNGLDLSNDNYKTR